MDDRGQSTRRRILEVATAAFAVDGYSRMRVRDICSAAEANIAAISYHFGDKEKLYHACLESSRAALVDGRPRDLASMQDVPAEERLHAFVRAFLRQMLLDDSTTMFRKMAVRALVDRTDATDQIIEEWIRPQVNALCDLLRQIGETDDESTINRSACSVIGQIVFYYYGRQVVDQMPLEKEPFDIDGIADHITRFTVAGLHAIQTATDAPPQAT